MLNITVLEDTVGSQPGIHLRLTIEGKNTLIYYLFANIYTFNYQ